MLLEVLHYLGTPCSREARRRGYLSAAVSLWSRERRCRREWEDHYVQCHKAIDQALQGLRQRRTVLVLGSGLGRDIDLARLAGLFKTVLLADVIHLWPVRIRSALYRQVRRVEIDLSGASNSQWETGYLVDPLSLWREKAEIDLVISANVLSQLPLLPVERVSGESPFPSSDGSEPVAEFGRRIIAQHLDGLRAFDCRVCLLTDRERLRLSRAGQILEQQDLLWRAGGNLPSAPLTWDWRLAPFGEEGADFEIVHRACAYPDFNSS